MCLCIRNVGNTSVSRGSVIRCSNQRIERKDRKNVRRSRIELASEYFPEGRVIWYISHCGICRHVVRRIMFEAKVEDPSLLCVKRRWKDEALLCEVLLK
jgi:hypothetical protein